MRKSSGYPTILSICGLRKTGQYFVGFISIFKHDVSTLQSQSYSDEHVSHVYPRHWDDYV